MTKHEIAVAVAVAADTGINCRIYFGGLVYRSPMFGRFVKLKDHDHVWGKGMVRFVNHSKKEKWDEKPNENLTKLYPLESFSKIAYYE